jgi:methylmalonyl-CoA mutase cobalamin-binding subunit
VLLAGVGPRDDPSEAVGLARALRDVGGEVVHLGEVPSAAVVAAVARDEDADVIVVLPAEGADAAALVADLHSALVALGLDRVVVVEASGGIDVAAAVAAVVSVEEA